MCVHLLLLVDTMLAGHRDAPLSRPPRSSSVCSAKNNASTKPHSYPSLWAAIESIAPKIGCVPQTLNDWVKKAEVDSG